MLSYFVCEFLGIWHRVSNGTPSGPALTYSNLGNMPGGNLGWDERPPASVEHRSNREDQRKPQTPSEQQQQQLFHQQQMIQRNSRPELTDLVEAMNNLRTRKPLIQFVMCVQHWILLVFEIPIFAITKSGLV